MPAQCVKTNLSKPTLTGGQLGASIAINQQLPGMCMKRFIFFLSAGLVLILTPSLTNGAQTAQARLFCWSLRFQGATAVDGNGFEWSQHLTTLPAGINGELALDFFNSGYTHSTYLELDHELFGPGQGAMALNVPDTGDANGNGFSDFFEVSQAVNSPGSSGFFQSEFGNGPVSAAWYREAGAVTGVCTIVIPDPTNPFGDDLVFYHTFELIEYTGPVTYTPGTNAVSCSVTLTQSGNAANTLQGPLAFTKSTPDPFNTLTLDSASLTNASLQTLSLFSTRTFLRDSTLLTNYYGGVEFIDGDPDTGADDYYRWMLSIDDLNDADNDDIPDFSDNPQTALPRQPLLSLTRGTTNLLLTISGDVGSSCSVQETGSMLITNWSNILSLTLTNDPQTVSISRPSVTKFWRVLAQ